MKLEITIDGRKRRVELNRAGSLVEGLIDDRRVQADVVELHDGTYSILVGGRSIDVRIEESPSGLRAISGGREFAASIGDPRKFRRGAGELSVERQAECKCTNARESRPFAREGRRCGESRAGLARYRSDENAKRNSLTEIRHRGKTSRGRRSAGERRRNARGCSLSRNRWALATSRCLLRRIARRELAGGFKHLSREIVHDVRFIARRRQIGDA